MAHQVQMAIRAQTRATVTLIQAFLLIPIKRVIVLSPFAKMVSVNLFTLIAHLLVVDLKQIKSVMMEIVVPGIHAWTQTQDLPVITNRLVEEGVKVAAGTSNA